MKPKITGLSTDDLFEIENVRSRILDIMDSVNLTHDDVYRQMQDQYQTVENRQQIDGWFDGTVKDSSKQLVAAFMQATIRAIRKRERKMSIDQIDLFAVTPERHFLQ